MKVKKKKVKKQVAIGVVNIKATFNNTIVTITDESGNVVSTGSSGMVGFKGTKKGTPFAAQLIAEQVAKKAMDNCGMKSVHILVNGPGAGRETAIRAMQSVGLDVESIKDVTPIPHNGCRPRKRRRV
ncbi:30S ribosomal protein S11 [Candidatus Marinamargulisbacteria bacterium SCGC AG-410-N11]|nr:30S ribosomal protein S11 [Candidatus Marinamargulisbacteria bacterium SCGC AG-410-N11]